MLFLGLMQIKVHSLITNVAADYLIWAENKMFIMSLFSTNTAMLKYTEGLKRFFFTPPLISKVR